MSFSNLLIAISQFSLMYLTGEDSSVSTPTSQGEGARTPGDSQENTRSGVRPRLQRQMAQSRKTFRFRKSKHGQSEVISAFSTEAYSVKAAKER